MFIRSANVFCKICVIIYPLQSSEIFARVTAIFDGQVKGFRNCPLLPRKMKMICRMHP